MLKPKHLKNTMLNGQIIFADKRPTFMPTYCVLIIFLNLNVKALVNPFNKDKTLKGAFSVIVKTSRHDTR